MRLRLSTSRLTALAALVLITMGVPVATAGVRSSCVPAIEHRCDLDVLGTSSIANLRFGASPAQARAVIDALLHQGGGATEKSGSCRVRSQITWWDQWTASAEPSLTLYFGRSGLVGYEFGAPQEPRKPTGGWMLATRRGLRVDSTFSSGRRLYGAAFVWSAAQGGVWLIRSGATRLRGYAWTPTPTGTDVGRHSVVATIDAGDVGCPAVSP
jgi:hypothetical protein